MTIPNKYLSRAEGAIASYSWTDIAAALGYVSYNLFATEHFTDAAEYNIAEITPYSSIEILETTTQVSKNFDSSVFNLPRIIKGTAVIDASGMTSGAGMNWELSGALVVVRSGSEVSTLGHFQADKVTPGSTTPFVTTTKMPLTETNIKCGDSLRLKVTLTRSNGAGTARLFINPTDADFYGYNPIGHSKIHIPFKIDL